MRRHFLWPIMVALVAAGCGDGTGPTTTGTFQATVSGSVSAELEGVAEFGIFAGEGLGLSFRPSEPQRLLGIGHRDEARPAPGTYTIGTPEEPVFFAMYMHQTAQGLHTFISESGELVITSSTDSLLEGSFEFRAVEGAQEAGAEVWVTGTFSATCVSHGGCD